MDRKSVEDLQKIRLICGRIIQNPQDVTVVSELHAVINDSTPNLLKVVEAKIISIFYPMLKSISENKSGFKYRNKQIVVDTLKVLFDKIIVDKLQLFFNIYGFLLFEIYDPTTHIVLDIPEEFKLSIVECMASLSKSLSSDLINEICIKNNAPKLCQMLYVLIEYAKNEQMRRLKIASINCIMAIARVSNDDDFNDLVMRNQIAEIFQFFLPGIVCGLKVVALSDEKIGHKVQMLALKAWGRLVTLMMQDYNASDEHIDVSDNNVQSNKWKNVEELKEYLNNSRRNLKWYKTTDKQLQMLVGEFSILTHHSHAKVRLELTRMASLVIGNCLKTMPNSIGMLIEIVIALSEDEDDCVAKDSARTLANLSEKIGQDEFRSTLENLEEGFYNSVTSLPRKFNGIDDKEKLVALNLLNGYISLFGKHELNQILLNAFQLNKLIQTLIHISEIEIGDIRLLEEFTILELEPSPHDVKTPWKKFRYFNDESIQHHLGFLCVQLAKFGSAQIVSDCLLDVFNNDIEHRKEATFLLNELVGGIDDKNSQIFKNILYTYIDRINWNLPLAVMIDEFGYEHTLGDVQNNIIQVCLVVEGIGAIALSLNEQYSEFLLKTLYIVLERAGSALPLVKGAGLMTLNNITKACGYENITALINHNIDYFSFYVERKLNRREENDTALSVLAVVMKYSTIDVLPSMSQIIRELLIQSCDKHKETNANSYLRVFKMFIHCLMDWFNISAQIPFSIQTKSEKNKETEHFHVSNVEELNNNFSDEIMGKSAEELYREDMEKSREEIDSEISPNDGEYKKPDPPIEVKMTIAILGRSLHFLPSKDRIRKLLVLDILKNGLEIIREWEDELLPMVHNIWSPLVDRFKEFDDPLIVNFSFQLLLVLARLSKEFIRLRTTNDVFPDILDTLKKLAKESFLKDKGSAYRYTQAFKLQQTILTDFANIIIYLDMIEEPTKRAMETVFYYLSDKQPVPLQKQAIGFFQTLKNYDPQIVEMKINQFTTNYCDIEYEKNLKIIQ